ncbi:MAG: ABC transporter ATP-binding protein [Myxococcales bacterium]
MKPPDLILRTEEVYKNYGTGELVTQVLHGISFALAPGELTLLMGPSGSGKTTLLSLLAGLLRPTRGKVELCSIPISELPDSQVTEVRRKLVGFVFQHSNLFPGLTAFDNVFESLRVRGCPKREASERAEQALRRVGLADRMRHYPSQLSGGQQQRVAVARAIADAPLLILGDEVTAALDVTSATTVMELLRDHVSPTTAVLLVTHDHRLERYAHRMVEMDDGRIARDCRLDRTGKQGVS